MKIQCDGQDLFEINAHMKDVICNDILSDEFEDDMKRRIHFIIHHKYERCLERMRSEWEPKLRDRVPSIPSNPEAFLNLVKQQPDYKDRAAREKGNIPA